jgi:hypothetical protein
MVSAAFLRRSSTGLALVVVRNGTAARRRPKLQVPPNCFDRNATGQPGNPIQRLVAFVVLLGATRWCAFDHPTPVFGVLVVGSKRYGRAGNNADRL